MKKRILVVVLLLGMVVSMTACGGEKAIQRKTDKIATVTIEDDKYVLTGDFQEVVGSMVENGLDVCEPPRLLVYDEEGMFSEEDEIEHGVDYIGATEHVCSTEWNDGTLLYSEFKIEGDKFDFETKLGITSDSKKKDIKNLEGFIRTDMTSMIKENYACIYLNGEMVDFSEYDDEYEEWVSCVKKDGMAAGFNASYQTWGGLYLINYKYEKSEMADFDAFIEEYDEKAFKGTVVFHLALNDALQKLEEGEVSTCSIVTFGLTNNEKDIVMYYFNYYYDPDYDMYKLWHMDK